MDDMDIDFDIDPEPEVLQAEGTGQQDVRSPSSLGL